MKIYIKDGNIKYDIQENGEKSTTTEKGNYKEWIAFNSHCKYNIKVDDELKLAKTV